MRLKDERKPFVGWPFDIFAVFTSFKATFAFLIVK